MTHVATAVLEITGPKHIKITPAPATNRAAELRTQKARMNSSLSNTSVVTWRVSSQKKTQSKLTHSSTAQISRTPSIVPPTKTVNKSIRSRMEMFEVNNENIPYSIETTVKTRQKTVTIEPKAEVLTNGRNNNEVHETLLKLEKKIADNNRGKSQEHENTSEVKDVRAKWEGKRVVKEAEEKKEVRKYRTVDVPIRPPVINIAVQPWKSSGQFITDSDGKEVEKILAQRRKLIEESIKEDQPVPVAQESVELRPVSLDPWYESIRQSSGESLTVSFPKAIDLARHQQRPLWRDIRGIQEAKLLDTLSKEGRICQEAKFEMMLSEASFLQNLNILKGHYMHNIHKHIPQVLSEKDYDLLFKHALDVRACSEAFLEDLDEVWQADPMLNGIYDVIRTHASDHFTAYIRYCRNMLDMSKHLAELISGKESFKNLLEVLINREGSQRLTLDAFLTSPMQRITKLPLLLKTILDKLEEGTDDYKQCVTAYEAASKVAAECDEVVTEKKRLEEMLLLNREIEFSEDTKSIPIVVPNRSLVSRANVKHFAFREKATKREKLQLILFSDLLLVTKRKSDKLFIVVDHCNREHVRLKEMENTTLYGQEESTKQLKPVILTMLSNSHDKKLDLVVTFKDQGQVKEWLQIFAVEETEEGKEVIEAVKPQELNLSSEAVVQLPDEEKSGSCQDEAVSDDAKVTSPVQVVDLKVKNEVNISPNVEDISRKPDDSEEQWVSIEEKLVAQSEGIKAL